MPCVKRCETAVISQRAEEDSAPTKCFQPSGKSHFSWTGFQMEGSGVCVCAYVRVCVCVCVCVCVLDYE